MVADQVVVVGVLWCGWNAPSAEPAMSPAGAVFLSEVIGVPFAMVERTSGLLPAGCGPARSMLRSWRDPARVSLGEALGFGPKVCPAPSGRERRCRWQPAADGTRPRGSAPAGPGMIAALLSRAGWTARHKDRLAAAGSNRDGCKAQDPRTVPREPRSLP